MINVKKALLNMIFLLVLISFLLVNISCSLVGKKPILEETKTELTHEFTEIIEQFILAFEEKDIEKLTLLIANEELLQTIEKGLVKKPDHPIEDPTLVEINLELTDLQGKRAEAMVTGILEEVIIFENHLFTFINTNEQWKIQSY